ncbi:hypothetical protein Bbelb_224440 [Branchiostoma belcheri]|nr:hypothetical protein Bbelb_224440 [Branchiostoma belcheri]
MIALLYPFLSATPFRLYHPPLFLLHTPPPRPPPPPELMERHTLDPQPQVNAKMSANKTENTVRTPLTTNYYINVYCHGKRTGNRQLSCALCPHWARAGGIVALSGQTSRLVFALHLKWTVVRRTVVFPAVAPGLPWGTPDRTVRGELTAQPDANPRRPPESDPLSRREAPLTDPPTENGLFPVPPHLWKPLGCPRCGFVKGADGNAWRINGAPAVRYKTPPGAAHIALLWTWGDLVQENGPQDNDRLQVFAGLLTVRNKVVLDMFARLIISCSQHCWTVNNTDNNNSQDEPTEDWFSPSFFFSSLIEAKQNRNNPV